MSKRRRSNHNYKPFLRLIFIILLFMLSIFGCLFLGYRLMESLVHRNEKPNVVESSPLEEYHPVIGEPPYRIVVDAGHGGKDLGAQGYLDEWEMTAETASDLCKLLEQDENYLVYETRSDYTETSTSQQRIVVANSGHPDLLLSIHGNAQPNGTNASGFECYLQTPGRKYHQDSLYFGHLLASGMKDAGQTLRGVNGCRYIYYQGKEKLLVESANTEIREERTFTILEDAACPAVLAEQCFVTNEQDVERFGSTEGCKLSAQIYYRAICSYFGTEPIEG